MTRQQEGYLELRHQSKMQKLLKGYGLADAKCVATPLATGYVKEPDDDKWEDVTRYQLLVGSLLHLSCWTRPDICYAVHMLCQKGSCPYNKDWIEAKRVLAI